MAETKPGAAKQTLNENTDSNKTASKPKKEGSSTTHRTEQPVMLDTTGVDVRKLLGSASGKDFEDMTSKDFEDFAVSKGVVKKDVRRMVKAFDSVKKNSARQFLIDTDGFNVLDENLPLTRSGRDIGNKKGLDIGDIVGAGRDVSLLAGFASRELTNYRKDKEKKELETLQVEPATGKQLETVAKPSNQVGKPAPLTASSFLKRPASGTAKNKPTSAGATKTQNSPDDEMIGVPNSANYESSGAKSAPAGPGGFTQRWGELLGSIGDTAVGKSLYDQVIEPFIDKRSEAQIAADKKSNRESISSGWDSVVDFMGLGNNPKPVEKKKPAVANKTVPKKAPATKSGRPEAVGLMESIFGESKLEQDLIKKRKGGTSPRKAPATKFNRPTKTASVGRQEKRKSEIVTDGGSKSKGSILRFLTDENKKKYGLD